MSEQRENHQQANRTAEQFVAAARNGQEGAFGGLLMAWQNGKMSHELMLTTLGRMFEDAPESVRKEGVSLFLEGSQAAFAAQSDALRRVGERVLQELVDSPHAEVAEAAAERLGFLKGMEVARTKNIVAEGMRGLEETEELERKLHEE